MTALVAPAWPDNAPPAARPPAAAMPSAAAEHYFFLLQRLVAVILFPQHGSGVAARRVRRRGDGGNTRQVIQTQFLAPNAQLVFLKLFRSSASSPVYTIIGVSAEARE